MTAEARVAVAARLVPRTGKVSPPPFRGYRTVPSRMSPALSVRCDWPTRRALFVGDRPPASLTAAFDRHRVTTVLGGHASTPLTPAAGPFTLVVVDSSTLRYDAAMRDITEARTMWPTARLLLAHGRADSDVGLVARALQVGMHDVFDPDDAAETDAVVLSELAVAGRKQRRVLAVGARLADVEIGCGGTLLDHRARGDRLSVLTFGDGGAETSPPGRDADALLAARTLGAQLLSASVPDRLDEDATARLVEEVVDLLDPTVVYLPSVHDRSPEQRTLAAAGGRAIRNVSTVLAYPSPSADDDFQPTRFVSIDAAIHRKIDVVRISGSADADSDLEPEMAAAGIRSRARSWARYRAQHLVATPSTAVTYAEPFEVVHSARDASGASPSGPARRAAAFVPAV